MSVLTVGELMSRDVVMLRMDHALAEISGILALVHVRHLPVESEGKLVGLVTHRDLMRAFAQTDGVACAKDIMTKDVVALAPGDPALKAAELMRDRKIGCVVVVEDEEIVGIITEADFLQFAIREISRPS